MAAPKKTYRGKHTLRYRLYTYDLWGNARDGYEVNDVYDTGHEFDITARGEVCNAGTMDEFVSFYPTDRQINRALGDRGVEYEGESKYTLYGENRYGDPVQEIRFVGTVTKHANGDETVSDEYPETKYTHFATLDDHRDFCVKRLEILRSAESTFPIEDWKYEVNNNDTSLSYREWLLHKCEDEINSLKA